VPKPDRSLLPTAEEAVVLEWAARREIIRRKLQRIQHRDERPHSGKKGVEYLVERLHQDGHL
jgi:hypothetical protein